MRFLNHCLTEIVLFFLAHPYAPAHFLASVAVGLGAADWWTRIRPGKPGRKS